MSASPVRATVRDRCNWSNGYRIDFFFSARCLGGTYQIQVGRTLDVHCDGRQEGEGAAPATALATRLALGYDKERPLRQDLWPIAGVSNENALCSLAAHPRPSEGWPADLPRVLGQDHGGDSVGGGDATHARALWE